MNRGTKFIKPARSPTQRRARAKLEREHAGHGKIEPPAPPGRNSFGDGSMLIARPLDIDALVRRIRKGRVATMGQIRKRLAHDAGADFTCPLTTGIFLRLVAEAAEEDRAVGVARIAPYWRVIRDNGELIDKFPGGVTAQATALRDEGFEVGQIGRGRKLKVLGFERLLAKL